MCLQLHVHAHKSCSSACCILCVCYVLVCKKRMQGCKINEQLLMWVQHTA